MGWTDWGGGQEWINWGAGMDLLGATPISDTAVRIMV